MKKINLSQNYGLTFCLITLIWSDFRAVSAFIIFLSYSQHRNPDPHSYPRRKKFKKETKNLQINRWKLLLPVLVILMKFKYKFNWKKLAETQLSVLMGHKSSKIFWCHLQDLSDNYVSDKYLMKCLVLLQLDQIHKAAWSR